MKASYYHFYSIPKPGQMARRLNIEPAKSAAAARAALIWYQNVGIEIAVYVSQLPTAPNELPYGSQLWTK